MTHRWLRLLAALLTLTLIAAACGDDGDTADDTTTTTEATPDDSGDGDEPDDSGDGDEPDGDSPDEPAAEGVYDLGGGAVLDVNTDCPGSWDPMQGITDDEIMIGMSLPESGVLASFGTLDDGMQIYFDSIEPIDGRTVTVISEDDAYDPGRTETNVEEIIDTEGVFAFANSVGTANTLRIRGLLDEECIPMVFASTGAPEFGDPADFPFVNNGLLSYAAEALAWCEDIAATLGRGCHGRCHLPEQRLRQGVPAHLREVRARERHRDRRVPAPRSGVARHLLGADHDRGGRPRCPRGRARRRSTAPESVIGIRSNNIDPEIYVSATCAIIGLFWQPQGAAVDGFRMMTYARDVSDPQYADDPVRGGHPPAARGRRGRPRGGLVRHRRAVRHRGGDGPASGRRSPPEGLNRATLVEAMWNLDTTLPYPAARHPCGDRRQQRRLHLRGRSDGGLRVRRGRRHRRPSSAPVRSTTTTASSGTSSR